MNDSAPVGSVYLMSPHPLVLEELPLWFPGTTFHPVPIALTSIPARESLRLPRRSLCVLDACFPPDLTEPFVAAMLLACPGVRVIVMVSDSDDASTLPLLQLGVKGLVPYAEVRQQLLPALAAVAKGSSWVPRLLLSRLLDTLLARNGARLAASPHALSRREREVLSLLLENLSNKEIGGRLSISERTVKFHVSNLLAKFAVARRIDLVLKSQQSALVAS